MTNPLTLYLPRKSGLHSLHPLTTLAIVAFCLVAIFALPGPWGAFGIYLLVLLPLAAWGRILSDLLSTSLKATFLFAISIFLIQGIFWPGGTPVLQLGPVSFKSEGLAFALQTTGRVLGMAGSTLLLTYSTRPDALMLALDQRGAPKSLTYIVLATIQIIPRLQTKASAILDAQRARGLETEGGIGRRMRAILPLVVPLVLGSIIDIDERAMSLEARAFSRQGAKTSLLVLHDTTVQRITRFLIMLGVVAVVVLSIWLRRLA